MAGKARWQSRCDAAKRPKNLRRVNDNNRNAYATPGVSVRASSDPVSSSTKFEKHNRVVKYHLLGVNIIGGSAGFVN